MVNIDISTVAAAQSCLRGPLGKFRRTGTKGRQIIAQVALVLGDFVTILLADLLASIATGGGTRFSSTEWYDLPLFVGCCLVLGLYSLKAFNHDQRLRVRLYAVVLFTASAWVWRSWVLAP